MEKLKIDLPNSIKQIDVEIERKKIKTVRLKVFPNMDVKISVPLNTSDNWIETYVNQKSFWIEEKLFKFDQTLGYAATNKILNGMSIKLLGQDMIFSLSVSQKEYIYSEAKYIHISAIDINDQDALTKIFDKWWREKATIVYQQYIDTLYPIVGKYNIEKPKIRVRKMKTLWGSCSLNSHTITLNQYLLKGKPACIEYVVLHELVHLLYPNHSKSFYNFLSNYMPDWKERKKILDYDIVHGL